MDFVLGLLVSSLKLHFKSAGIITLDQCFYDTNLPKNVHYQKMLKQILQTTSQLIQDEDDRETVRRNDIEKQPKNK